MDDMAGVTFSGATPDDLKKALSAKIARRLEVAAIILQNEMKIHLSEKDNLKGTKDSAASAGDYPFKVSGQLAGSVTHEVDKDELTAKVGSGLLYSKFLQRGTRYIAPRPWVTLAWNACKDQIEKIINGRNHT